MKSCIFQFYPIFQKLNEQRIRDGLPSISLTRIPTTQSLPYPIFVKCSLCDGSAEPYDGVPCPQCDATGREEVEGQPITMEDLPVTQADPVPLAETAASIPPALFTRVCTALYGHAVQGWQTEVSKALQVNIRSIGRWQSGAEPIPEGVVEDLIETLGARRAAISEALRQLVAAQNALQGRRVSASVVVEPDPQP